MQRGLPRPSHVDYSKLMAAAKEIQNPAERMIAEEAALLVTHDALRYPIPGGNVTGTHTLPPLPAQPSDENLQKARLAISREMLAGPGSRIQTIGIRPSVGRYARQPLRPSPGGLSSPTPPTSPAYPPIPPSKTSPPRFTPSRNSSKPKPREETPWKRN